MRNVTKDELTERFWSKVDRSAGPGSCWPFTGARGEKGYGRIKIAGRPVTASRVAYELAVGPIGELCVLHRCDNPACCNPAHLFLGTTADNNADMARKGRVSRLGGARGEKHHAARFTADKVRAIRAALNAGRSARSLAREHGVSSRSIDKIRHGTTWALEDIRQRAVESALDAKADH